MARRPVDLVRTVCHRKPVPTHAKRLHNGGGRCIVDGERRAGRQPPYRARAYPCEATTCTREAPAAHRHKPQNVFSDTKRIDEHKSNR
jgi:hypothetical protein